MKRIFVALIIVIALLAIETSYMALKPQAAKDIRYFSPSTGNAASSAIPGKNSGSFEIYYSEPTNRSFFDIYENVKHGGVFDNIVYQINSNFALPSTVWIVFAQCGDSLSFYDPDQKKIEICYEFIDNMKNVYSVMDITQDPTSAAINNTEFVLYHEIGHALIDTLNIPVTGKEEDAADQLATLMLLENGQNNDAAVFLTAYSLGFQGSFRNPFELKFWDDHSLESQRFFNIMCWLYGQDPVKYKIIVSELMPDDRSQKCSGEYAKMFNSWAQLLRPHFKNS